MASRARLKKRERRNLRLHIDKLIGFKEALCIQPLGGLTH
jgi:hypothetical protein